MADRKRHSARDNEAGYGSNPPVRPHDVQRGTAHCSRTRDPDLTTASTTSPEPSSAASRVFTLAHLSDPHLTSLVGARSADLLNKRILGYLSWRRRRRRVHRIETLATVVADIGGFAPDHLAVTGDLTHIGLPAECEAALRWLHELGPGDRVSLVPGNHDRYVAAEFERTVGLWRDYFRGDNGSIGFPFLRRRGPIALMGFDTAVPTAPFLASGRVGDAQRAAPRPMPGRCPRGEIVSGRADPPFAIGGRSHAAQAVERCGGTHRYVAGIRCGTRDSRSRSRRTDRSSGRLRRTDAGCRGAVGVA